MNILIMQAIPVMAGTLGIAFLYQLYKQGRTQVARRRRTDEEYWADLSSLEEQQEMVVQQHCGFETLESTLTLSITVVCLELLCYLIYLSVTQAPMEDAGLSQALRKNIVCYAGLTMVTVAGFVRVKRSM